MIPTLFREGCASLSSLIKNRVAFDILIYAEKKNVYFYAIL